MAHAASRRGVGPGSGLSGDVRAQGAGQTATKPFMRTSLSDLGLGRATLPSPPVGGPGIFGLVVDRPCGVERFLAATQAAPLPILSQHLGGEDGGRSRRLNRRGRRRGLVKRRNAAVLDLRRAAGSGALRASNAADLVG